MPVAAATRLPDPEPRPAPSGRRQDPPAIDLVFLSRQTFGDRALETELLRMFDHQSTLILQRMAHCGGNERKAQSDLAHTLKGSARAVGAVDVAAAAQAFENIVDAAPETALRESFAVLSQRVERARSEILRLLAE